MLIDDAESRFKVIHGQVRKWNGARGVVQDIPIDWDPWVWTEPARCGRVQPPDPATGT
jgi:hypothetical protein